MSAVGCALLLLLAGIADLSAAQALYKLVLDYRANKPLLETSATSRIQCGLLCLGRDDCTHWSHEPPQCTLYPTLGSEPDATHSIGPIWLDKWIPEGYQLMPGTNKSYRAHMEEAIGKVMDMPEECAKDHARATPAFLTDGEQVNFARSLMPTTFQRPFMAWVGIKETETDKVYGDFDGSRTVTLQQEWFAPWAGFRLGKPCLRIRWDGLDLNGCKDKHGYVCEYQLNH